MAARKDRWRRLLGAGAVAVLAATAAGCGRGDDPPPDPTAAPDSSPAGPTSPAPADHTGADFPDQAQEYAERTVAAWAAPDLYRLGELAAADVRQELVELPGPPARGWQVIGCEPTSADATATGCAFYNPDGDELRLTVDHGRLGEAHAVGDVEYDPVGFPDDPVAYVSAYVAAWQGGNPARAGVLATAEVTDAFARLPADAEPDYALADPVGSFTSVVVTLTVEADGAPQPPVEITVSVDPGLLGEPRALRAAAPLDP